MSEKIERTCPVCWTTYEADSGRLRWGRQTTCSRKCSYRFRSDKLRSAIILKCSFCGEDFQRCPSHVRAEYRWQFCSRDCKTAGWKIGMFTMVRHVEFNKLTREGRTSLRRYGAIQYASGSLGFPQDELATVEALQRTGVPFIHQHVFEADDIAFVVDFYFADRALVIEIDGVGHRARTKQRRKDAERDKILADAGIEVCRITNEGPPEDVAKRVLARLVGP